MKSQCLILGFCLSAIALSQGAFAASSCNQTFMVSEISAVSNLQLTNTINELARLSLQVDSEKAVTSNMMNSMLEKKFKQLFNELLNRSDSALNETQLKELIKTEIQRLQNNTAKIEVVEQTQRKAETKALYITLATKAQLEAQDAKALEIRTRYNYSKTKRNLFQNLTAKKWKLNSVQLTTEPLTKRDEVADRITSATLQEIIRIELRDEAGRLIGENFSIIDHTNEHLMALQRALGEAWSTNNFFNIRKANISLVTRNETKFDQSDIDAGLDVKRYLEVLELSNIEVNVSNISGDHKTTLKIPATLSAMKGDYPTSLNDFHQFRNEVPDSKKFGEFAYIMKANQRILDEGLIKNRTEYYQDLYLELLKANNLILENVTAGNE